MNAIHRTGGTLRFPKINPGSSHELSIALSKYFALKAGKWSLECEILISEDRKMHLVKAPKLACSVADLPEKDD
jgi:hypothetical protein